MKRWFIGTNSYYKTASYILQKIPWWAHVVEEANFVIIHLIGKLPFVHWGKDSDIFTTIWIYIYNPIFHWCERKAAEWWVEMPYDLIVQRHNIKELQ